MLVRVPHVVNLCKFINASKIKTLTIGEKQKVLKTVKSRRKKNDIAGKFGIPVSTLCTIIQNSKEIDLNFSTDRNSKRNPEFSDIEESVVKWFIQCRDAYSKRKSRQILKIIQPGFDIALK